MFSSSSFAVLLKPVTLTSTGSDLNTWIFREIQFTFFYEFTPSLGPGSISWQQELSGAVSLHWSHIILILTCALLSCSWGCPAPTPLQPEELDSSSPKEQTPHHPLLTCWVQSCAMAPGSTSLPPSLTISAKVNAFEMSRWSPSWITSQQQGEGFH